MTFRKKNQVHENNPGMVDFPFPVVAVVAQSGFSTLPSDKLLRMASRALEVGTHKKCGKNSRKSRP